MQAETLGCSILAEKLSRSPWLCVCIIFHLEWSPPAESSPRMPTDPQDGTWYIVITCSHCRSTVYLFRDLTEGKGALDACYVVKCPYCQQDGEYEARHYYHQNQSS